MTRLRQTGDTIIEVMLAMSILSFVLFISWGVANRATLISLAARQRVDAVNQLKEQAEILKSQWVASDSSSSFAEDFLGEVESVNSDTLLSNPCDVIDLAAEEVAVEGGHAFHVGVSEEDRQIEVTPGVRASDRIDSLRYWVQYKKQPSYVELYIRGCWEAPGGSRQHTDSSQIVLRLNI